MLFVIGAAAAAMFICLGGALKAIRVIEGCDGPGSLCPPISGICTPQPTMGVKSKAAQQLNCWPVWNVSLLNCINQVCSLLGKVARYFLPEGLYTAGAGFSFCIRHEYLKPCIILQFLVLFFLLKPREPKGINISRYAKRVLPRCFIYGAT